MEEESPGPGLLGGWGDSLIISRSNNTLDLDQAQVISKISRAHVTDDNMRKKLLAELKATEYFLRLYRRGNLGL